MFGWIKNKMALGAELDSCRIEGREVQVLDARHRAGEVDPQGTLRIQVVSSISLPASDTASESGYGGRLLT